MPNTEPITHYPVSPEKTADLDNRFTYHVPKPGQPERYSILRETARQLADTILQATPQSREQSAALTNLEQAIFWANAAIAHNE